MITADEARALNPVKKMEVILKDIEEDIKAACFTGETSIRLRYHGFGDSAWYGQLVPPGYETQVKVIKTLNEHGFKANIRCEERQFVDIFLEVSW